MDDQIGNDLAIPAEYRDEYANNVKAMEAIKKKYEEKKCEFRVKIHRRRSATSPKQLAAVFGNVTVQQIEEMDIWMPEVIGSGVIDLIEVYDPAHLTYPFAVLTAKSADYRGKAFDFNVLQSPDYRGPTEVLYPRASEADAGMYGAPQSLVDALNPKPQVKTMTQPQQPGGVTVTVPAASDATKAEREAVTRMREQLLEQKTQLEIEQTKREADLRLRAAQQEADRLRVENERAVAEMNRRMDMLMAQISQKPVEQPKGLSLAELLPSLITAAAPIIASITESSRQTQMAIMQQQAQMAQQNAEANRTLMTTLLSKKPIDDTVLALMTKPDNSAALLQSVTSAFGDTTRNMMQIMSMATEMMMNQGGNQEQSVWPDILKSVVKAYVTSQANVSMAVQKAQQQSIGSGSNVVPMIAPPQPQQTMEAAEPAEPKSGLDVVKYLITVKGETPARVAHFILKQIDPNEKSDGSVVTALMAAKSIREFMLKTLGDWIDSPGSKEYVRELVLEVVKLGGDRGLWNGEEFMAKVEEELGDFGVPAEESAEGEEEEEEDATSEEE